MKKFKLISETGTEKFEAALDQWIVENNDNEIISVSHSTAEFTLQLSSTQTMTGLEYSALILFIEKEPKSPAEFGF